MTIAHLVSNKTWGGGERYALDLAAAQQRAGHNVAVFTRRIEAVSAPFADAGLKVAALPLGGALDIISPLKLSSWCNRCPDDSIVLHVNNFKDAATAVKAKHLASKAKNVRVVCTRHLVAPAKTDRRHIELYRSIDAIIFVSQLALDTFMSSAPDVDTSRLHMVHNAVRTFPAATEQRPDGDDTVRLLYMGRLAHEKGLHVLLSALELIKNINLRLTVLGDGEGPYVMPLVRRSRDEGTDRLIDWVGHVADTAPYVAACDIGVVPTVAPEAFGLSVAEMMAAGKAVVTTSNGAQREIITDGRDGLLVPPSDPEALAAALRRLASDSALRRSMGANAAETIRTRFAFDHFYSSTMRIYNATF